MATCIILKLYKKNNKHENCGYILRPVCGRTWKKQQLATICEELFNTLKINLLNYFAMNLTLIKNFFLSTDNKKSIEPAKVSRVLRRSFRVKRSKQILESNREKRKSGKAIFM